MKSGKRKVRYEEMLPHELEEAVAAFPVAYCPFGSLERHGRHLPLGNDTLKAFHILVMEEGPRGRGAPELGR